MVSTDVRRKLLALTNICIQLSHSTLSSVLQIFQPIAQRDFPDVAVSLKVETNIDELGWHEITTLMNSTRYLRMICGSKNFGHAFLVYKKFSSVDGVQYDLKNIRKNAFIFQLDHLLVGLLQSHCKHYVEIIAIRSQHDTMSWKDVFTNFQSNVDELTFVSKLSTFPQKNIGMGNHFPDRKESFTAIQNATEKQCHSRVSSSGDRVIA